MKAATLAAPLTALACTPRLLLWADRPYPLWYLEAILVLGGFVLWAFVFAWHPPYTGRPVFTFKPPARALLDATAAGVLMGLVLRTFVDPLFRPSSPEDYPADLREWFAMTLFSLGFSQLFLVFAPFAWSIRLSRRRWFAALFTVAFGVFVLVMKLRTSSAELAPALFALLLGVRAVTALLTVWFFSRQGVLLAWWWGLLLQARHLLSLSTD